MYAEEFTKSQYEELRAKDEGQPIRQKWFRHKTREIYKFQLNIMEMGDYEEVV